MICGPQNEGADHQSPTTTSPKQCEVCARNDSKYTCPRCEVKTCSLDCSKIHKSELDCSGIRDKTKFVPINRFTNLDLLSDYRLLEEVKRVVEVSRKKRPYQKFRLQRQKLRLQHEAMGRKIELKYLPSSFNRHKVNGSCFNHKAGEFEWTLDLVFVNCDNLKFTEHKVAGSTKIAGVLHKYLDPSHECEVLKYYQSVNLPGIRILLNKGGRKYYEVDAGSTLTECLKNRVVIEYPTIYLLLRGADDMYDVVDTDDEDEVQGVTSNSGQAVIDRIVKKGDESLYESGKNFFVASEYSDEED